MKILIFVIFSESSLVTEFHGNSSHTDHFKLLKEDGTSVLVGARNIIYNLSLPDLQEYTDQVSRDSCSYILIYIGIGAGIMARWVSCDQPDHHKSVIFPAALDLMNLFIVWGEFFALNYSPNSHVLYSLALNL